MNDDLEYNLQQAVGANRKWLAKSVHDELAALREASVIIRELERRTGKTPKALTEDNACQRPWAADQEVHHAAGGRHRGARGH